MARGRNADRKRLSGFAVGHGYIPLRNVIVIVIVIVIVMLTGIQFGILCRVLAVPCFGDMEICAK
jgi:hypothetical protein